MKQKIHNILTKISFEIYPEFSEEFKISKPNNPSHGDWTSNLALILAKKLKKSPIVIAEEIINRFDSHENISNIEVAGAGFINFFLKDEIFLELTKRFSLGNFENLVINENPKKILLEYVSSNPTGPIHVGHGRSAAYGSAIANLYKLAGNKVIQEYYINDRGLQAKSLGLSVFLRMQKIYGKEIQLPEGCYEGDYINNLAEIAVKEFEEKFKLNDFNIASNYSTVKEWLGFIEKNYRDFSNLTKLSIDIQINQIKESLVEFRVEFDEWFKESTLFKKELVNDALKSLKKNDISKKEGASWFRSTNYGDEKDRVLIRDDNEPTYFASDIAYHKNKYERGFNKIVNVWGADHHGYIPRVKASIESLGLDSSLFSVLLIQFVSLKENGKKVQMSTRSGEFIELSELIEKVGIDSTRYYFLARKPEQSVEFDIDLAKKTDKDNHVYYIQYAHARICSLKKELSKRDIEIDLDASTNKLTLLKKDNEKDIISFINSYPEVLNHCYRNNEVHPLCFYLRDLSSKFHSFYNSEKIISEDEDLRDARIVLSTAIQKIIKNGLDILKIDCPESM